MSISVLNTDVGLSGKTLATTDSDQTITGLKTFDNDPAAPFAVTASSAVVTNLDADKWDGQDLPADPNADRVLFWDDSAGSVQWLALSGGLSISGTTLTGAGKYHKDFLPADNEPPTVSYATPDVRNGHPVLDFDAGATEYAIFTGSLPVDYAGNGLTVTAFWAATSATTGDVVWTAEIDRLNVSALDMDSDSFASAQTTTTTTAANSGQLVATAFTFTSGAAMDSAAAGEVYRLRIARTGAAGGDTMTGDAELRLVQVRET